MCLLVGVLLAAPEIEAAAAAVLTLPIWAPMLAEQVGTDLDVLSCSQSTGEAKGAAVLDPLLQSCAAAPISPALRSLDPDEEGLQSIDKDLRHEIVNYMRDFGVNVQMDEDAAAFPERQGAKGMYIPERGGPGTGLLKPDPSSISVIELLIHVEEHRGIGWASPYAAGHTTRFEVAAQHILLAMAPKVGWGQAEVDLMRRNLQVSLDKM